MKISWLDKWEIWRTEVTKIFERKEKWFLTEVNLIGYLRRLSNGQVNRWFDSLHTRKKNNETLLILLCTYISNSRQVSHSTCLVLCSHHNFFLCVSHYNFHNYLSPSSHSRVTAHTHTHSQHQLKFKCH